MIDKLGTAETYNHYPTGWAVGFSTPFRMFKRYTYQGGVCDPLVISWPKGIQAHGEVRHQYHHSTDIYPTILEACGIEMPEVVNGYQAVTTVRSVDGLYRSQMPKRPLKKETQYYEMMGSRGIWHKGWKAVAEHGPTSNLGNFENDHWQLFHTDDDRSEAHDVADQNPEKVEELKALWMSEAKANNVLPLNDMGPHELGTSGVLYRVPVPPSGQYTYYPGTSEVPEQLAANTHGVSYKILAEVDFVRRESGGDSGPGLEIRRALALRQGRNPDLCLQLPWHPTRAADLGACAGVRSTCGRRGFREGPHG